MTVTIMSESPRKLREQFYNATVSKAHRVTDGLIILRVTFDSNRPVIDPGQYLVLGLGNWESRSDRILAVDPQRTPKLIRRAYSVSCPLWDGEHIVGVNDRDFVEFCIRLVDRHSDNPAMLTPRLFALQPGDRLFAGEKAHGNYTLAPVQDSDTVLLMGTGTGEAPHNAMIAELLTRGHNGPIVCAACARYGADLAYLDAHRQLERQFDNYHYIPLTTREPWNTDTTHRDYVGKQHLQDWITSEDFRSVFGSVDPSTTHAFLCGSPLMIGLPTRTTSGEGVFPEPVGMVEVLTDLAFKLDRPGKPGNIHVEKYW